MNRYTLFDVVSREASDSWRAHLTYSWPARDRWTRIRLIPTFGIGLRIAEGRSGAHLASSEVIIQIGWVSRRLGGNSIKSRVIVANETRPGNETKMSS